MKATEPGFDVHYGKVGAKPPDWREHQDEFDDKDTDEELDQTPQAVIDLLGFDPKEFSNDAS
jgi:hypothetical protein